MGLDKSAREIRHTRAVVILVRMHGFRVTEDSGGGGFSGAEKGGAFGFANGKVN
jgi:hypothetical protein